MRGLAAFFALYSLLALASTALLGTYNQNAWWIDLSGLPPWGSLVLQLATTLALAYFAAHVSRHWMVRIALALPVALVALFAFANADSVYSIAASGLIILGFPLPFSVFVGLIFSLITAAILLADLLAPPGARFSRLLTLLCVVLSFALAVLLFPLGQMFCFGTTEYRERVDAAVVLGAQVYPDGTPSPVLQDRLDTGIRLYQQGLAPVLVMSGGIDADDVSEARAMREYVVKQGVPIYDIVIDEYGSNTQRTAANTVDTLRAAGLTKVAAVSNFYHLARIKMLYLSEGLDVVTVPCQTVKAGSDVTFNVLREIPGWWYYWAQNLLR
ncbi:MAG: YdcF family protein [Coriobacteriales bacterium]|jgi:vancomycin permeability regulator SanA|nr:YdcF family protein [Coriobacteriales bacterium]